MVIVRRAAVLVSVVSLLGSATLVAQRGGRGAPPPTISDAQRKAIDSILRLANDLAAGRPVANDLSLAWVHDDLLRVQQQGQSFVPFILTLDTAKTAPGPVTVYWRVVSKDAPAAVPAPTPAKGKQDDKAPPPAPVYAYQGLNEAMVVAGQPLRINRSFTVGAGNYDVYVVVKEGSASADAKKTPKEAPTPKSSAIKQTVTVPDLWSGELSASSIIVAEKLERLTAPLSVEDRVSRPYALGGVELVPFVKSKFTKTEELAAFVLIYNAKTDAANAPDVKVEFNFYTKQAGAEKFFNATLPTNLNGQTLSAQDIAAGQLQAATGVPLASFPDGDYRMEVKITDNMAKKEFTRDFNFSVAGL